MRLLRETAPSAVLGFDIRVETGMESFVRGKQLLASSFMFLRYSAAPHGKPRLPLDGFSRNLTFEYFSIIRGENSIFIKILQDKEYFHEDLFTRMISL
jgi:hypothetical protein